MKRLFSYAMVLFLIVTARASAQRHLPPPTSPEDIINRLWTMATTGELLTPKGMGEASAFYLHPAAPPTNKSFSVVSNFWGAASLVETRSKSDTAEVIVGYEPAGNIDSALRYTPPPPSRAMKFGVEYHLSFAPTHSTESILEKSGSVRQKNGYIAPTWKIKSTKTVTGPPAWFIDGPQQAPFATVNAAIRYVLEMRGITKNPAIKRNADQTLRILLRLDDLYRKEKVRPSACACC